jgi:hypothetical protein
MYCKHALHHVGLLCRSKRPVLPLDLDLICCLTQGWEGLQETFLTTSGRKEWKGRKAREGNESDVPQHYFILVELQYFAGDCCAADQS